MATATDGQVKTERHAGRIVQVIGSTFDAEFDEGKLPTIYNAVRVDSRIQGRYHSPDGGGAAAPGRQSRPLRCPRLDRRLGARHVGGRHRRARDCPRRQGNPGQGLQSAGRADRRQGAGKRCRIPTHPPPAARAFRAFFQDRGLRDRHQGHRSLDAAGARRQGRSVRRRRPGQDRHSHRTDRPHRQSARRLLGVCRRRRAHPRRQRLVAGNARNQDRQNRSGRAHADGHGVRPDERTARRSSARRLDCIDDVRVVSRFYGSRHTAVRRQHLPVLAGRLGGFRGR